MSALSVRILWKFIAFAGALSFLYAAVLAKLGRDWWTDENYSHGLLVPIIIIYIVWLERERFQETPKSPNLYWGSGIVVLAIFLLWVGTAGAELFVQRISLAFILIGIVVYFWGFKLLRLLFVPLVLLLLAIPIPSIIFNKIAFPLQLFASRCAVWLMRGFDIPVLRQGNVIELMPRGATVSKKMEVVEACSGIRSLMTLVTLAVVFAYFTFPRADKGAGPGHSGHGTSLNSYGLWRSIILVLAAIPIAIATNALRVGGTGVLAHYFGSKIADGFFHSLSGWVVYILAFLMLFALGWTLDWLHGYFARRKSAAATRDEKTGTKKPEGSNVGGRVHLQAEQDDKAMENAPTAVKPVPLEGVD